MKNGPTDEQLEEYMQAILPQAQARACRKSWIKETFYVQVKRYIADKGLTEKQYDQALKRVSDALDY